MPHTNIREQLLAEITDVTASATELNVLDVSGMTLGDVLRATDATTLAAGDVEHAKAVLTGSFTGLSGADNKKINITSVPSDNSVIRRIALWISNDTGDYSGNFTLTIHLTDSHLAHGKRFEATFNLTYTETNGGASAMDTTDTVDAITGLTLGDRIRYMGGTAEERVLTAVPSVTTLTFEALSNAHADNTGIVRVAVIDEMIQIEDDDGSSELHFKLVSNNAPATTNVAISIEVQ